MKLIEAKYGSKCRDCGAEIEAGSQFWYDPYGAKGQKAVCVTCHSDKPGAGQQYEASEPLVHDGQRLTVGAAGIIWHDSLADLLDAARRPSTKNLARWKGVERGMYGCGERWYGLPTLEAVRRAVAEGWDDGVRRVEENFSQIEVDIASTSKRRRRRYADQGDELRMDRVWNGQIDRAWQRTFRENRSAPRNITLAVDLPISCNKHADDLFWKGAAALFLADRLTDAGFNVEVIAISSIRELIETRGADENNCRAVRVKAADAPLDLGSLAASICLAGFWRHYMLQADMAEERMIHYAHGYPTTARQVAPEQLAELNAIDGFGQVSNLESATLFVREVLASLERGDALGKAA